MKPAMLKKFPYTTDSASLFAKISDLNGAVFIDSGRPYSEHGRYDILSALPYATINSDSGFSVLKKHMQGINITTQENIPFTGGAIGYFAYDLAHQLEDLPKLATKRINLPEMTVGIYDWALVVDHHQRQSYFIVAGTQAQTMAQALEIEQALLDAQQRQKQSQSFKLQTKFTASMDFESYKTAFSKVKQYIHNGDCYQINLTQQFKANYHGSSWDAYQYLRTKNPAPYAAYLHLDDAAILSCSPERFIKVENNIVETKPIKGTRPRHSCPDKDHALAQELLNSDKDKAENLMIVDLLRNDISKNCKTGSVHVPHLFSLESFATVHHLVTTVRGKLDDGKDSIDLFKHCFPGGSITGAPKIRAMEIIEELEPTKRGVYCGSIAYFSFSGHMDSNIAIRTLVCQNDEIFCSAGGAIVADSTVENEYQECFDKVNVIFKTLEGLGL